MAKLLSEDTSDQNKYSGPVPLIGLYIAGASLVCFLLISFDVIHGIHRRKRWLPCQFFSLNSVTLILFSVGTKLPVDLTTPMPTPLDQLSKLTGTALLCVCMGFLAPSLGSKSDSECFTNLAALSILVLTVVVNICMQIATGLISSFIVEHVMIMCFMFYMLMLLWWFDSNMSHHRETHMNRKKDLIKPGRGSMLRKLKLCYLHGYGYDPQFQLCRSENYSYASFVCLSCLILVLQASLRSFVGHGSRWTMGLSDYAWSMRIIVWMQIVVILVASLGNGFRYFGLSHLDEVTLPVSSKDKVKYLIKGNYPYMKHERRVYFVLFLGYLTSSAGWIMHIILLPPWVVFWLARRCLHFHSHGDSNELDGMQEYRHLMRENDMVLEDWTLRKFVQDIQTWTTSISAKHNVVNQVSELLLKTIRIEQSLEQFNNKFKFKQGYQVSCLDLVFLARIISICTTSNLGPRLTRSLGEVLDIILFVEKKMNSSTVQNKVRRRLAKAMWMGDEFHTLLVEGSLHEFPSVVDRALHIMKRLKKVLFNPDIWEELAPIMNSITGPGTEYATSKELYDYMESLFVNMLHILLAQLPCAIYKQLSDSHVEEYQVTVRRMLKFLWQVRSLDGMVQWSFPHGTNITTLTDTQVGRRSDNLV